MAIETYCTVTSGLGEGGKFLAMPQYNKAIHDKLGITPFLGTFNLLPESNPKTIHEEIMEKARRITDEFERDGRRYGGLWARHCQLIINNETIDSYVIIPEIDKHREIIEVIAPFCIRTSYEIEDGERVKVVL